MDSAADASIAELVTAQETDVNVPEDALNARLAGIGLKFEYRADGHVSVTQILPGGPCFFPEDIRVTSAERRESGAANGNAVVPGGGDGSQQVEVGDILLAVEGAEVRGRPRRQIAHMVAGAVGSSVNCRFARACINPISGAHDIFEYDVSLTRERKRAPSKQTFLIPGVGLVLRHLPDFTFEVADIVMHSPAAGAGKLAVGDRLWMVNGEYVDQLRIRDVQNLFENPPLEYREITKLTAIRGLKHVVIQLENRLVVDTIDRRESLVLACTVRVASLGAAFTVDAAGRRVILSDIEAHGPCDATGMLAVSDALLAVGDRALSVAMPKEWTADALVELLDGPEGSHVILQIRRPGRPPPDLRVAVRRSLSREGWDVLRACSVGTKGAGRDAPVYSPEIAQRVRALRPVLLRTVGGSGETGETEHGGLASSSSSLGLVLVLPKKEMTGAGRVGVQVHEVRPNSAAARAGLRVGDMIRSIDGHCALGLEAHALEDLLRGPSGSTCAIAFYRLEAPNQRDIQHCMSHCVQLVREEAPHTPASIPLRQQLLPTTPTDARLERLRTCLRPTPAGRLNRGVISNHDLH